MSQQNHLVIKSRGLVKTSAGEGGTTVWGLSEQPSAMKALGQTVVGTGSLAWGAEPTLGAE